MKKFIFILSIVLLNFTVVAQENFPLIEKHWLRAAPPNAMMMAAYGQLTNNTKEDRVLIGAYSPDFANVEIHQSTIINGVATMKQQHEITLIKGESLIFQPNGLHIMLMNPQNKIKLGDKIKICLIYKKNGHEEVQHIMFPVEKK